MDKNRVEAVIDGKRVVLYVEDELVLAYIRQLERELRDSYTTNTKGHAGKWDDIWRDTAGDWNTKGNDSLPNWAFDSDES